jgi:hypothetical protein
VHPAITVASFLVLATLIRQRPLAGHALGDARGLPTSIFIKTSALLDTAALLRPEPLLICKPSIFLTTTLIF